MLPTHKELATLAEIDRRGIGMETGRIGEELKLDPFKVTAVYEDGTADLECPQRNCGGTFTVDRQQFKEQKADFVARPCPYCFRAARVPSSTGS